MKKIFFITALILSSALFTRLSAQVVITRAEGWLESAYVKWLPVENADSYAVYYSGEGITDKKVDSQLIRNYGDYYRVDVLGLRAGTYTLKIAPVVADEEGESTVTEAITVLAHDRSGYAHSAASPKGTASGAYNDDGTLRAGAQVIYVTPLNAKELDIYTNYLKPREKDENPLIPLAIRFIGVIKSSLVPGINSVGLLQLKGSSADYNQKVTFEGVGDDSYLEFGLDIVRCSNVEIRNLGFKGYYEDAMSVQTNNTNIWIHNNDFFYGQNRGGDKAKGDGSADIKDSQWCTVSYNHYWESGKANLFGNGDDSVDYITHHHNFFDHSDSRHPRVRCAKRVHVYNNYMKGIGKYGVGATRQSSIFVESNYFENSKNPMLSSRQGTDILDGDRDGSFTGDDGGIIKSYNNKIVSLRGNYRKWAATGEQSIHFDAYEVENRMDQVPVTVIALQGGSSYSNFDQNLGYDPLLDTPDEAKAKVERYAGRVNGGDLKISFGENDYLKTDNPDPAILRVLAAYTSQIVDFGGGGGIITPPLEEGDMVHNFTTSGKTSTFFTIVGNLQTKSGVSVSYNGLTLTQYLKIESSTKINFTTTEPANLTLVFETGFSDKIKINGTSHTASSGILSLDIPAGDYEITKDASTNLFYMSITYDSTTDVSTTIESSNRVLLYPNPASDYVYVKSEDKINRIELYTLLGKPVPVDSDSTKIDVSELATGSYIVKINLEERSLSRIISKF